ncbi:hypothetical protein C8R44DRAFT_866040 [Mycena epipterygia]|nr:hypothetical protein C8R44DRAFT_866040 [Mycena epipterygia]
MSAPLFYVDAIDETSIAWAIAAAETFLYGAYLVIFGFYLHVLRTHGIAQHYFLTASTILLFILGTAHCALQLATTILGVKAQLLMALFETTTDAVEVTSVLGATIPPLRCIQLSNGGSELCLCYKHAFSLSVIADSIFIFRCYAIWGCRRKIVIFPIILTLAVAGGIAFLAVGLNKGDDLILSGAVLAQLVGIAPTIIAVRVGLGYSVENVGSFIAAAPRTRPPPQFILGTPSVESLDGRVLYLHADGGKSEGV